ncbi:hypothetical protein PVT67_01830 [Gallaecimonas kandeliae]|uniref:hypothetical protein n=1 Tax=Gallaecimonas kandeliae TaxID=3029055 RepID=UPI002647E6BF|nr:hypothetical protein [Gallaecimonas kandeliae]WKE66013.1 hypothetical protein PVT67_01830 [Gallaecimonas kandeliae]
MKHWLNLLTAELLPPRQPLTVAAMIRLLLLAALLLALGLGWGYWQRQQLAVAQQQLKARQLQAQQRLATLEARFKEHQPDMALVAQRDSLKSDTDNNKTLLARVEELDRQGQQGFSGLLTALAQSSTPGLWLSQIDIDQGRLALGGKASKAELVPQWLQGFAKEPALAAQAFGQVKITQGEDGYLAFRLDSEGGQDEHH